MIRPVSPLLPGPRPVPLCCPAEVLGRLLDAGGETGAGCCCDNPCVESLIDRFGRFGRMQPGTRGSA
jgi:hypothetical protein